MARMAMAQEIGLERKKRAFVCEGIVRECLAVTRSLGRQGIEVDIGDPSLINPTRFSKYVNRCYKYPDPKKDLAGFSEWLIDHCRRNEYDMVFPLNDYTFQACTKHQDELRKYTNLVVNDLETFMLARDKTRTLKVAQELGLSAPKTWFPASVADLPGILDEIDFAPILLKPAESSGSRGIEVVQSKDELTATYERLEAKYGAMLIQEYVPGTQILDVPLIFNREGELRGGLVNNRVRMFPNYGGPNVAGHAIRNDRVRDDAVALMRHLDWKGVGLVEYKLDERTGEPKLMEINPRFWGSTQLGISAGINWPYMLFQIGIEGDCQTVLDYQTDILLRWLVPGELMHFLTHPRKRELYPEFFRFWDKNTEYYIYDRDDLLPFAGVFLTSCYKVFDVELMRSYIFRK